MKTILPLLIAASTAQGLDQIVDRGPHHQTLQSVSSFTDTRGRTVLRTNHITQLADHLCYLSDQNSWELTREEFHAHQNGFVASQGPIKVTVSSDIFFQNAVEATFSDGHTFQSAPAFLALRDGTGQSVLVAAIQNSIGRLVAPNVILFDQAFDNGVDAAIRLTFTRSGIEQDVLLFDPEPFRPQPWGLDPPKHRDRALVKCPHHRPRPSHPHHERRVHR